MTSSKNQKIKIALIQLATKDGEIQKNHARFKKILETIKGKIDLIVLPEMWLSGFDLSHANQSIRETNLVLEDLKQIARTKKCYFIGSHLEKGKKGYYNTASIISPQGKIIAQYRKIHLFKMGREEKKFLAGDKISVTKTSIGRIGLAICYDIRFPEFIRKEVLKGTEILVIPSAWPRARIDHYLTLLKARAIENQCFVISANKMGKNSLGVLYGGNSVAFDPWGKNLGQLKEKEGILQVMIDLEELHQIRKKFPVLESRREKIY